MTAQNPERRTFLCTAAATTLMAGTAFLSAQTSQSSPKPDSSPKPSGKYQGAQLSSFNPLQEKGMPLQKQTRNWGDLTKFKYNKEQVHSLYPHQNHNHERH